MAQPERFETRDAPSSMALAILIVIAGAALRFWGLGHGIPFALGVDEPEIVTRAVQMMKTGGATAGVWNSLTQVEPADFYLWGRAVTAVLGTATIVLAFRIGVRWGTWHGLLAAALLAVLPSHVRESHFVLNDVPMTFFTTLAFLLTLRACEQDTDRGFAIAGVACGVAAATKYTGGLVLFVPLLAAWLTPADWRARMRRTGLAVAGTLAAFLVAAPYSWLDLPGFLNGYGHLAERYRPRESGAEPGWLTYLKYLRLTLRWPGMILMMTGLGIGLVRSLTGPARERWMPLVAFPVAYVYFISGRPVLFGRYLMPILPFACLLVATAVLTGVTMLKRWDIPRSLRTAVIIGVTLAVLLPVARQSIAFSGQQAQRWTQAVSRLDPEPDPRGLEDRTRDPSAVVAVGALSSGARSPAYRTRVRRLRRGRLRVLRRGIPGLRSRARGSPEPPRGLRRLSAALRTSHRARDHPAVNRSPWTGAPHLSTESLGRPR